MSDNLIGLKQIAAASAARLIESGMVVGLGTGSTAALLVDAVGARVREGLQIVAIPTSDTTEARARALGIAIASLAEYPRIDLTIDGADEVETSTLALVKGRGGALLHEKIVASASARLVIIVDDTKLVTRLGTTGPLPVEVIPFGWTATARKIQELGGDSDLRRTAAGKPFITDSGHYILNCNFHEYDPVSLAKNLDSVVGVVEHGLFLGMTHEIHVGESSGVRVISN